MVRLAVQAGVEPMVAIQMATINSAEAYRIDHLIGSVTPGKIADILLVEDLETFKVQTVITNGKVVAQNKKLTYELKAPKRSELLTSKLKCAEFTAEDFTFKVEQKDGKVKVLSMNVIGPFVRKRRDAILNVENHRVQPDVENDVLMVSVIERFGKNGNKSLGFCSGWKLKKGAMASSAAPDDNNIVVLGANPEDMAVAVNHLRENGGGQVVVCDGKIMEFLPLPVGGICSDDEPEEIARIEKLLSLAANELGCDLPEPLMYMFFLPITAIPDYAITDVGPVDCIALKTFNPILEENVK